MELKLPWSKKPSSLTKLRKLKVVHIMDAEGKCILVGVDEEFADVIIRAVNAEEAHRKDAKTLAFIRDYCKVVYFPQDGSYPVEHYIAAAKGCFDMLEAIASEKALGMGGSEL